MTFYPYLLPALALLGYVLLCHRLIVMPESRFSTLWLFGVGTAVLQLLSLAIDGSMSFFASLSWVSALMAVLSSVALLRLGERFLPFLSFCVAAFALVLHAMVPGAAKSMSGWQIHLHASVALLAYAGLSLAGVQAILLLIVERRLKARTLPFAGAPSNAQLGIVGRFTSWLPPLSRLERQLFQLIGTGFGLLTLTLLSGALFISNWSAQHLIHKTVLTIAAWVVFGVLLLGHWRLGWRGRQAAMATLVGMLLLGLAFFGSKFVLEIVLRRGLG
jgi:ABC-type uncharacterized transport system permease subunit